MVKQIPFIVMMMASIPSFAYDIFTKEQGEACYNEATPLTEQYREVILMQDEYESKVKALKETTISIYDNRYIDMMLDILEYHDLLSMQEHQVNSKIVDFYNRCTYVDVKPSLIEQLCPSQTSNLWCTSFPYDLTK